MILKEKVKTFVKGRCQIQSVGFSLVHLIVNKGVFKISVVLCSNFGT